LVGSGGPTPAVGYSPNIETYTSMNEPYFALASAPGISQWSTFPAVSTVDMAGNDMTNGGTLNAEIFALPLDGLQSGPVIFTDTSGAHELRSITGDLYFDNELLAKAGDIQNVADWALYPALAAVDMDGFALNNVQSLELDTSGGSSVTLTSSAAGKVLANGVPLATQADVSGAVAQWSSFPALTSVDLSGETLVNAASVGIGATGANGVLTTTTAGTVLQFNGATISTGTTGDVSQWSSFPALTSVDLSGETLVNAASVGIGATGANGVLTTGVGGTTLLFNGAAISTGTTGDVSQWSTFPAVSTISTAGNTISSSGALPLTATGLASIAGTDISLTATETNPVSTGSITATAGGGSRGQITLQANEGNVGLQAGGQVLIQANGGNLGPVSWGGLVEIDANTGGIGDYGAATSAIKLSAAGINSYAGAIPSVGSLVGYNFIYGTAGVNICSGLPALLPNIPTTTYIYGTGGVGLEAGLLGDVEVKNSTLGALSIKPRTSNLVPLGDLVITGRNNITPPNQYVQLAMVKSIAMDSSANISNVSTLAMNSGAITGVSTINGAAYPPASTTSQWATFPAVQNVDISGFNIDNVDTVTGAGAGGFVTNMAEVNTVLATADRLGATFNAYIKVEQDLSGDPGVAFRADTLQARNQVSLSGLTPLIVATDPSPIAIELRAASGVNVKNNAGNYGPLRTSTHSIYDTTAPTKYGDLAWNDASGRLFVSPNGTGLNYLAYLTDIPQVYIAQYYNSAAQNLTSGNTNISFDSTQAWNNVGGKITHTNGTTTFTVASAGIYQLEFKSVISVTGTTLSTTTNRNIAVDVTRGGNSSEIQTSASTVAGQAYAQSVSGTLQLLVGDVITLRLACVFTGTAPQALGVQNVFDYNTAFTWTFIK